MHPYHISNQLSYSYVHFVFYWSGRMGVSLLIEVENFIGRYRYFKSSEIAFLLSRRKIVRLSYFLKCI